MASLVYNFGLDAALTGGVDFDTDSFKLMLVTSTYTPDKDAHQDRADVTNEVSGTGYTSGGAAVSVTVTQDNANDRVDIDFASVTFSSSTITAAGAVIYKSTGNAATDTVICYLDFGGDVSSTAGDFTVNVTTPLRFQN
jgi:hypothetical protein